MKAIRIGLLLAMVVAVAAFVVAGDKPWFDLENCSMCKGMTAQEGLMENMTWDHYLTKNGMMTVGTVAEGYEEKYQASHKTMKEAVEKLKAGEEMYLCGFCTRHGELARAGVNMERFTTKVGDVSLMTSSDEKQIEEIHAFAQKTIDELAKMAAVNGDGEEG
ncbi:MAG: hypothetical protein IIA17_00685 [candidate division Zixibacteria bacterium]|nr:hypothetical protein [candidate division Zixibacteria bacterium]